MSLLNKKQKYAWFPLGITHAYFSDAEAHMRRFRHRWPDRNFRVYGHSLSGFQIQIRMRII